MTEGTPIRTFAGRAVPALSDAVLELPNARGRASTAVYIAAVSVMLSIDELFDFFEQQCTMAVIANLRHADLKSSDLDDMLIVLYNAGYITKFFKLCRDRNDRERELRRYLLDRGILWNRVLQHYEFEAWDAAEFAGGFVFGVGQSFAEIIVFLRDVFEFFIDEKTSVSQLYQRLSKTFRELWELGIPALLNAEWLRIQAEFSEHLLNLDFYRAGMVIGKLGADLFGLLSGVVGLAKLLGKVSTKVIRELLPLVGRELKAASRIAAEIVARIGPAIVASAQRVGIATLGLFTRIDEFARWLVSKAVVFFDDLGNSLIRIERTETVGLTAGAQAVAWGRPNMGWRLVVFNVPVDDIGRLVDDITAQIDRAWQGSRNLIKEIEQIKRSKIADPRLVEKAAAKLAKTTQGIVKISDLSALAQKVRNEMLLALRSVRGSSTKIDPKLFGKALHSRMAKLMENLSVSLLKDGIKVFAERSIRTIAKEMGGKDDLLDQKLFDWARRQPDLAKNIPHGETGLESLFRSMGHTEDTLVGDLTCDAVLMRGVDEGAEAAIVDWTSDRKLERLAEKLEEIRLKAGGPVPAAATENVLKYYGTHAQFTLYVRHWIMMQVFPTFAWTPTEVLYSAVNAAKF